MCHPGTRFIFVRHVLVFLYERGERYKAEMIAARQEITRLKKELSAYKTR